MWAHLAPLPDPPHRPRLPPVQKSSKEIFRGKEKGARGNATKGGSTKKAKHQRQTAGSRTRPKRNPKKKGHEKRHGGTQLPAEDNESTKPRSQDASRDTSQTEEHQHQQAYQHAARCTCTSRAKRRKAASSTTRSNASKGLGK